MTECRFFIPKCLGLALGLALAPGSQQANAQGLPFGGANSNWSGFYAGLQVGFASSEATNSSTSDRFDATGADYGLHAGYRRDLGNWVLGAELEFSGASLDFENVPIDTGIETMGFVKLIGGADLGRFLVYTTAGGAFARIDSASIGKVDGRGYFAGIGGAYRINGRFSLGLEYKHSWLKEFDVSVPFDTEIEIDTVELRASYRF